MERASGVLMPISALPGPYGIGCFGKDAYDFVDFLARSEQRYWQVLPLTTTSYGDSPYQSFSAYAGNPYFIDLDALQWDDLLKDEDLEGLDWGSDPQQVDYAAIFRARRVALERAVERFAAAPPEDFAAFCERNASWLQPYCEYMCVKEEFGLRAYHEWPREYRRRGAASAELCGRHPERILYHQMTQYLFYQQWNDLKAYANERGVLVVGDLPIYVSRDSVEMWAQPELFLVDADGTPTDVAGTPPDQFSATGQYWGNPIYDWEAMAQDGYAWWVERMRWTLSLYDVVRLDHFRGFESFWDVPFGSATSAAGDWAKGPGMALFDELRRQLGDLPIIAEDLGFLTPEVHELLAETGYPGMKVLQFAFDAMSDSEYQPHNFGKNCVVYTGTHDNDTTRGWFDNTTAEIRDYAFRYLGVTRREEAVAAMIRAAMMSVADICIIPMQDYLGLGSEARINTPSTLGNNWKWRAMPNVFTKRLARQLKDQARLYARLAEQQ